ncbi:MAG: hypothetical protein GDA36_12920 [Rhodobacteraceae bacterium]|nr:hypothetical protein [Paracoccaceae bacterium]
MPNIFHRLHILFFIKGVKFCGYLAGARDGPLVYLVRARYRPKRCFMVFHLGIGIAQSENSLPPRFPQARRDR